MGVPVEDKSISVRGTEIHLLRAGSGEPVLFLHGAGGNASIMPFQEKLAEHFELWIPEHPGFGYSRDVSAVETMEDLVFFYLDFLDEVGLDSFHLMGQSLGGWLAAELAVIFGRHRLRSLVLIDAVGIWLPEKPMADLFVLSDEEASTFLAYDKTKKAPPLTEEQLDLVLQNRYRLAQLAWDPYLHNPHLRKRLHRIQVPTLIVWGENDPLVPLEYAYAWQNGIAGAELAIIGRCGHTPTKEQPEAFIEAVLRFHSRLGMKLSS